MLVASMVSRHAAASYALLCAVLLILITGILGWPVAQRLAFLERLAHLRTVHGQASATLTSSSALLDAPASWEPTEAEAASFLNGDTAPLAAAELQNQIRRIVERERGVLVSSAFRSRTEPSPLTPVSVVVRLRCSVESLMTILHGLEGHEADLFVDNLSIQSNHRAGRALRERSDELDVEFEITGYLNRARRP